MMPRESDGKMRRGGSKAARTQHQHPVDERGRVHGVPELSAKADKRVAGKFSVVLKTGKEKRRWGTRRANRPRLRGQRSGGEIRRPQRALPAVHGHSSSRSGDRPELHDGNRRSVAVPPLARCRRLFRPDLEALAGCTGHLIDFQGRISKAGDPDVRFSLYEAASGLLTRFKSKDKIKSLGRATGQTQLSSQGGRRRGAQNRRRDARDVAGRHRLCRRCDGSKRGRRARAKLKNRKLLRANA